MMDPGTEETGDRHLTDMKGAQDHLFQEMSMTETEGHHFLVMNVTEGLLSHQMNEIRSLGWISMVEDPQGMTGTESLLFPGMNAIDPQGMRDILGMNEREDPHLQEIIGMGDHQGMEMIAGHLSSGMRRKQAPLYQKMKQIKSFLIKGIKEPR